MIEYTIIGVLVFIMLILIFFLYVIESRKCKHRWFETNRITGLNLMGCYITEVHLKCMRCGDVKKVVL